MLKLNERGVIMYIKKCPCCSDWITTNSEFIGTMRLSDAPDLDLYNCHCGTTVAWEPRHTYQVGDTVSYRPSFGVAVEATITECEDRDGRLLYSFDNGHWAYQHQVDGELLI
jgi:hypothetical protein